MRERPVLDESKRFATGNKKPDTMAGLYASLLNTRRNDRMDQIYDMAT